MQGRADVLLYLLSQTEFDMCVRDYKGWTALHWAVACAEQECLAHLLSCPATMRAKKRVMLMASHEGDSVMHVAARTGNVLVRCTPLALLNTHAHIYLVFLLLLCIFPPFSPSFFWRTDV